MAKGLSRRAFLKRIMHECAGLPPSSNARLFDGFIFNHNILGSVKKKINILIICQDFFLGIAKKSLGPSPIGGTMASEEGEVVDMTAKGD
jgi:hypothetical protein